MDDQTPTPDSEPTPALPDPTIEQVAVTPDEEPAVVVDGEPEDESTESPTPSARRWYARPVAVAALAGWKRTQSDFDQTRATASSFRPPPLAGQPSPRRHSGIHRCHRL